MRIDAGSVRVFALALMLVDGCGDSEGGGGPGGGSGEGIWGAGGTGGQGSSTGGSGGGIGGQLDADSDGYVAVSAGGDDCDDSRASVNPGVPEVCNGIDDDCDTRVDERNAVGCSSYYLDADEDGYGSADSRCLCGPNGVTGYDVTNDTDCYDGRADAHPDQTQYFYEHRGDGSWDYDCDGVITKFDLRTTLFSCTSDLFSCTFSTGWEAAAPDCGETRNYGTGCFYVPLISCEPNTLTPVDQTCR